MSLIDSEVTTKFRGSATVTIDGKSVRLTTGWHDRFHFKQSYGALDQLKDKAKSIVSDYEKLWGPAKATIVYHEQTRTETVQTYLSVKSKVLSTETAGTA